MLNVKIIALLSLALACCAQNRFSAGTGYDQTGMVHITGPNGLDAYGAFHFQDLWTPNPEPGVKARYRIKIVFDKPDTLRNWVPDIVHVGEVFAQGTEDGHYIWRTGEWRCEMLGIDETFRQQVSWEGKKLHGETSAGTQTVTIVIGTDTLTISAVRY